MKTQLDPSAVGLIVVTSLAFAVSAYAHYLDVGQRWTNKFGEPMSLAIIAAR